MYEKKPITGSLICSESNLKCDVIKVCAPAVGGIYMCELRLTVSLCMRALHRK